MRKEKKLDITKYTGFFHDGSVLDIDNKNGDVFFLLESSQIDPEMINNRVILSETNTLRGKLCLKNVKTIKVGHKPFEGVLHKIYDDGEILDLEISPGKVFLLVEWVNFPPKSRLTSVDQIEIEAEDVYWENLPALPT